ncbi:hypothetical protein CRG98_006499 [Punica granatum]|uniref:Uncharacterized protein n=1 Tax=Punica granatum TaxID=22663 RepID=A0A2I0KX90_PUNGR|nr:hypothetical protein CRG98_006499 [Punica granatum]
MSFFRDSTDEILTVVAKRYGFCSLNDRFVRKKISGSSVAEVRIWMIQCSVHNPKIGRQEINLNLEHPTNPIYWPGLVATGCGAKRKRQSCCYCTTSVSAFLLSRTTANRAALPATAIVSTIRLGKCLGRPALGALNLPCALTSLHHKSQSIAGNGNSQNSQVMILCGQISPLWMDVMSRSIVSLHIEHDTCSTTVAADSGGSIRCIGGHVKNFSPTGQETRYTPSCRATRPELQASTAAATTTRLSRRRISGSGRRRNEEEKKGPDTDPLSSSFVKENHFRGEDFRFRLCSLAWSPRALFNSSPGGKSYGRSTQHYVGLDSRRST